MQKKKEKIIYDRITLENNRRMWNCLICKKQKINFGRFFERFLKEQLMKHVYLVLKLDNFFYKV